MIKVATALSTILKGIKIIDSEIIKLTDALGRVLAEDVYAGYDIPQFANSAMDGYAVKSADLKGASKDNPKVLKVIEDVKAGAVPKKILKNNQATRIMTGAPLPPGANSVIMVEYTRRQGAEKVEIFREVKPAENIRSKGEDIKKGELVIRKGSLLSCAFIGILASLGRSEIKVARKPKVAILSTGDELVGLGQRLTKGKIRSSNTYTLFSQVVKCGGIAKNLGIAKDNSRQLKSKIKQGLDCDIILTSGGVSVGDYDLVKDTLVKMGTNIHFWKVAMRPGKPLVFGTIKGIPVFGLPGNPVSSMVSFEIFVKPAILKMLGQNDGAGQDVEAVLEKDIEKKQGLCYFMRANTRWQAGQFHTDLTGPQGSGILRSMGLANSLIVIPENVERLKRGNKVKVRFFSTW